MMLNILKKIYNIGMHNNIAISVPADISLESQLIALADRIFLLILLLKHQL